MALKVAQVPSTAKHFIIHYYCFRSETVSKAKLLKRNLFFAKLPKRNAFLAKRSETYEAKLFLWFRETEAKRSETVSVSLSFASKQNFFKAKLGHPRQGHPSGLEIDINNIG